LQDFLIVFVDQFSLLLLIVLPSDFLDLFLCSFDVKFVLVRLRLVHVDLRRQFFQFAGLGGEASLED
jgi:hypothetical protein